MAGGATPTVIFLQALCQLNAFSLVEAALWPEGVSSVRHGILPP